ncbi:cation-translocating P-type ATPase [Candidatus Bathyarchaeota archaeon]|nr:MAG: cation-translocating P-type ATPase [Candidatus Bathyarchaeota archaeon]
MNDVKDQNSKSEYSKNENNYYNLTIEETFNRLNTSESGVSDDEAKSRLEAYGLNELVEEKKTTPFEIFLSQFKSILIVILVIAAGISGLILHEYTDMAVILVIVILNAVIGFVQEYRAEKAVEALKKMVSPSSRVIRGGAMKEIPANMVVPGDILVIQDGDRIPADARLIDANSLKMDESPLTGESSAVTKKTEKLDENTPLAQRFNMLYMGTHSVYGRGTAVITSTGMNTEFGNIAELIQSIEEENSPLKQKTESLGRQLGLIALVGCIIVFVVDYFNGIGFTDSFMSAVSLAVSAIPEGLPTVMVITLSLGAQRMARSNAIIRKLNSVETLGTTTVICSDKTGTITKNEMTVRQIDTLSQSIFITGEGFVPIGRFNLGDERIQPQQSPELNLILETGLFCNDSSIIQDDEIGPYITGDPTEGAILMAAIKAGIYPEELAKKNPRVWEAPFDSVRKMMSTVNSTDGGSRVHAKGAPEVIIGRCNRVYIDGRIDQLSDEQFWKIQKQIKEMGEKAMRVLAFAYKDNGDMVDFSQEAVETDLVFIGLMGMIDPPRDEVPQAIRLCKKAGIRPVMITGDHKTTAIAIAREVGIIDGDDSSAITGSELDELSEDELLDIVDHVSVYARVSPEHKVKLAQALRKRGNIVAMTGDGVNDAPAIKAADIGIAMGIKGTDVTKEAADMVLADDNFASIVKAVEQGRVIYDNIRKFMRFMVSSNFDEMIVISTFVLVGLPVPFLPVMILWLNLVTDGGPAIALSMDEPTDDLMSIPPRNPKDGILHGMYLFIAAYVVLQSVTMAGTFLWKYVVQGASLEIARTVTFMQVCMFELVVVWNCRSEKHSVFRTGFNNKYLLLSTILGGLLTASLCYVPFLQDMFNTVPLSLQDWGWVMGTSLIGLLVLPEVFFRQKKATE